MNQCITNIGRSPGFCQDECNWKAALWEKWCDPDSWRTHLKISVQRLGCFTCRHSVYRFFQQELLVCQYNMTKRQYVRHLDDHCKVCWCWILSKLPPDVVFSPWLTDLQAGPVHISASSIAGNWKKWVITLLSHGRIKAKHYGSKYFPKLDAKLLLYAHQQAFNPQLADAGKQHTLKWSKGRKRAWAGAFRCWANVLPLVPTVA